MSPQINLDSFVRWNKENTDRISRLYQEIEEIQEQFNELYSTLLADWQTRVESLSDSMLHSQALPAAVAAGIEENAQKERAKLEARVAELQSALSAQQAEADAGLREAQAELAKLRALNPALDAREERLKARSLQEMEEIAGIEQELKSSGVIGRLVGQRDLKRKLRASREAHQSTLADLNSVREEWVRKKKQVEAHQAEMREKWRQNAVGLSEMQAELDHLSGNLGELSGRRGAQAFLAALPPSPETGDEFGDALALIGQQNEKLAAYRSGLASVAQSLGLLTGVKAGLERFHESASKVLEEQNRYNLKELVLDVAKSAIQFHNTWSEFQKRVKNERYLGRHPLEFVDVVREFTDERLTDQAIQAMFESMGQALTQATKAWD